MAKFKSNTLTIKEAAESLGVSYTTVYQWCTRGKIKCYQADNGHWQIPKKTLVRPEIPSWHFAAPGKQISKRTKKVSRK